MSELTGRGAGWTDERGRSQEGRRRLAASRERAGNTGSDPIDPAAAAELRRLVAEVLAEVLPGLSTGQAPGQWWCGAARRAPRRGGGGGGGGGGAGGEDAPPPGGGGKKNLPPPAG